MLTVSSIQTPTILTALQWGETQLAASCDLPRLEGEVLLAHVLQAPRSHLHAWPERLLTAGEKEHYQEYIHRRAEGEPLAYITGHREFWSLDLLVTPDTLIPRQETERLVQLVLEKLNSDEIMTVADLGTGSGAIALAIAHERTSWVVHATDISLTALAVAKQNAQRLHIDNIKFHEGPWCHALPHSRFDAIISNPPYIAEGDPALSAAVIEREPRNALISGQDGLQDIRQIILEAKTHLKPGGYLFLEHGFAQSQAVLALLIEAGYEKTEGYKDLAGLDRVSIGRKWIAS